MEVEVRVAAAVAEGIPTPRPTPLAACVAITDAAFGDDNDVFGERLK